MVNVILGTLVPSAVSTLSAVKLLEICGDTWNCISALLHQSPVPTHSLILNDLATLRIHPQYHQMFQCLCWLSYSFLSPKSALSCLQRSPNRSRTKSNQQNVLLLIQIPECIHGTVAPNILLMTLKMECSFHGRINKTRLNFFSVLITFSLLCVFFFSPLF